MTDHALGWDWRTAKLAALASQNTAVARCTHGTRSSWMSTAKSLLTSSLNEQPADSTQPPATSAVQHATRKSQTSDSAPSPVLPSGESVRAYSDMHCLCQGWQPTMAKYDVMDKSGRTITHCNATRGDPNLGHKMARVTCTENLVTSGYVVWELY